MLIGLDRTEDAIRRLAFLIPYLRPYRAALLIGLGAMLLATGFSRLTPWILKIAIDELEAGATAARIATLGGAMIAAAAVGALFLYVQRWLLIGTSRRVEYDLRRDLFSHLQSLDVPYFTSRHTGDLMAHFTNDLSALRDVAGPGIMYMATMTTTLAVSISLMAAIDPMLTLLSFAPYPLVSIAAFFFGRSMYHRSRRVQDLFGSISSRAQEDLAGTRIIRAYGQEEPRAHHFHALNVAYQEANLAVARLRGSFFAAMSLLAGSGLVIALVVGGRRVIAGTLSLGSLVALSAYLVELLWPVMAIGWVIAMIQRGASAAARLEAVRSAQATIVSGPRREKPAPRLAFERVSLRYPGAGHDALADLSFELPPGGSLGIVGRTGSGKSTILRLILRFYDPSSGRILIDDADVRERDLVSLRASIGYAPQDAFLFSRTIAENLAFGCPEAPRESIERVSRQVGFAEESATFPRGLDTMVGERGITLSGGQRQRVSLGRALLVEPDLLLLDDTLSHVDAETETRVLAELGGLMRGRTAIIVSHRISAVRHCDQILVLDEGRVIERGAHAELVALGGLYARILERQQIAAELEELA